MRTVSMGPRSYSPFQLWEVKSFSCIGEDSPCIHLWSWLAVVLQYLNFSRLHADSISVWCVEDILWAKNAIYITWTNNKVARKMKKIIFCERIFNPHKVRLSIGKLEIWKFMSFHFTSLGLNLISRKLSNESLKWNSSILLSSTPVVS